MHGGSAEPVASRKKCKSEGARLSASIPAAEWRPGDAAARQERELIQQLAVGITHNLNNLLTGVSADLAWLWIR